jgi:hypothetical protein
VWYVWALAVAALGARSLSGAYTPSTAPPFYRYQFDAGLLVQNIYQYADRSTTTVAVALLLFWLAAGRPRPRTGEQRHREAAGVAWLVLAFAPTLLLPVRSSLYALFPSVGAVIVGGALLERLTAAASGAALRRAAAVMLAVMAAMWPVYKARNRRYLREAELSAAVVREIEALAPTLEPGSLVVIRDARDVRPTAEQAFGPLADAAAQLMTGGRLRMWIDPPPAELASATPPELTRAAAELEVRGGRVSARR